MGIKLEYIVIILFVSIVVFATTIKLESAASKVQTAQKELEFKNTTFIEVDTEKMQSKLYTPYGVRKDERLVLDTLHYDTPQIESLLADKGSYKDNILHLDGHVILKETVGNIYKTEHAIYDKKQEILTITSPFVAYMGPNIYKGNSLVYDAIRKEANATKVDAVIYPEEK